MRLLGGVKQGIFFHNSSVVSNSHAEIPGRMLLGVSLATTRGASIGLAYGGRRWPNAQGCSSPEFSHVAVGYLHQETGNARKDLYISRVTHEDVVLSERMS